MAIHRFKQKLSKKKFYAGVKFYNLFSIKKRIIVSFEKGPKGPTNNSKGTDGGSDETSASALAASSAQADEAELAAQLLYNQKQAIEKERLADVLAQEKIFDASGGVKTELEIAQRDMNLIEETKLQQSVKGNQNRLDLAKQKSLDATTSSSDSFISETEIKELINLKKEATLQLDSKTSEWLDSEIIRIKSISNNLNEIDDLPMEDLNIIKFSFLKYHKLSRMNGLLTEFQRHYVESFPPTLLLLFPKEPTASEMHETAQCFNAKANEVFSVKLHFNNDAVCRLPSFNVEFNNGRPKKTLALPEGQNPTTDVVTIHILVVKNSGLESIDKIAAFFKKYLFDDIISNVLPSSITLTSIQLKKVYSTGLHFDPKSFGFSSKGRMPKTKYLPSQKQFGFLLTSPFVPSRRNSASIRFPFFAKVLEAWDDNYMPIGKNYIDLCNQFLGKEMVLGTLGGLKLHVCFAAPNLGTFVKYVPVSYVSTAGIMDRNVVNRILRPIESDVRDINPVAASFNQPGGWVNASNSALYTDYSQSDHLYQQTGMTNDSKDFSPGFEIELRPDSFEPEAKNFQV